VVSVPFFLTTAENRQGVKTGVPVGKRLRGSVVLQELDRLKTFTLVNRRATKGRKGVKKSSRRIGES
jgi:hypothetical protein